MSRQSNFGRNPGLSNRTIPPLFQVCAGQLAIASLLAMAIPSRPVLAYNDFQLCAARLVRLAAVSPEEAAVACSDALDPEDLSRCVVTIHKLTPTLTQEALVACSRVRRPVELSRCVFNINNKARESQTAEVIDYCRRSLLPIRYSECVVGLSREIDFAVTRVLETCIKAEDFPRDYSPTFSPNVVPPPSQNPTLPPKVPSIPDLPVVPANPLLPGRPADPVNP